MVSLANVRIRIASNALSKLSQTLPDEFGTNSEWLLILLLREPLKNYWFLVFGAPFKCLAKPDNSCIKIPSFRVCGGQKGIDFPLIAGFTYK